MDLNNNSITNPAIGDLGTTFTGEGSGVAFVSSLISTMVTIILIVGALYFIFQLMTGGVDWIRAGSDKTALEASRGKIVSAVLGLVVLLSAWAIFSLVEAVFGIDILNLTVPTLTGTGGGGGGGSPVGGGS